MDDSADQEFELRGDFIELVKLLKVTGLCQTGGHAKIVITEGQVKVDDEVETRKKRKVFQGQVVEFESQKIRVV